MRPSPLEEHFLGPLEDMNRAVATGDSAAFAAALEEMVSLRESGVLADVRRLSGTLHNAVERFRNDSRIATLAERDVPDARLRLDHVLNLTEQAAHRTLDLIEQSVPLADSIARDCIALNRDLDQSSPEHIRGFLGATQQNLETVRRNLQEVMLTQGFQDLTGQILRSVHTLIGEVESVLAEFPGITGSRTTPLEESSPGALAGPAIPGVSTDVIPEQHDVDDLIARLGL